jgi:hypothetical protein
LSLSLALAACGSAKAPSGDAPALLHAGDLPGWRAVDDTPGIAGLGPSLSGLRLTARVDSPALVRSGDAVRAAAFAFGTDADAAEALTRARGDDYARDLEKAFHTKIEARTSGPQRVGFRLVVPRPAEAGTDTVELYVLRRGRTVALVELVSARGFDPALRSAVLGRVSR